MEDEEPNFVTSGKSQSVVNDGFRFDIEIYPLEADDFWMLEFVDYDGTSHVCWDEQFKSDKDARNAALEAIESKGAIAFMRGDNVVPFPGS